MWSQEVPLGPWWPSPLPPADPSCASCRFCPYGSCWPTAGSTGVPSPTRATPGVAPKAGPPPSTALTCLSPSLVLCCRGAPNDNSLGLRPPGLCHFLHAGMCFPFRVVLKLGQRLVLCECVQATTVFVIQELFHVISKMTLKDWEACQRPRNPCVPWTGHTCLADMSRVVPKLKLYRPLISGHGCRLLACERDVRDHCSLSSGFFAVHSLSDCELRRFKEKCQCGESSLWSSL